MEEPSQEIPKRQRLDVYAEGQPSQRMHPQHPESAIPLPLHHTHPGGQALQPPNAYSQRPPPSPYDAGQEPRNLAENLPHGMYGPPHSGYNTPSRDVRQHSSNTPPNYQRHDSQPATTRSPDEMHNVSTLNTNLDPDPRHYTHSAPHHPADHPVGYPGQEVHPNGIHYHGLPMAHHHHDPSQGPPAGHVMAYSESPIGQGPPYSAGPYTNYQGHFWRSQAPMNAPKKHQRAQQACETCRQRKAKCDEGKPVCSYCRENNHPCHYKEVQPAKADRAQKEIMDQLKSQQEFNDMAKHQFAQLFQTIGGIVQSVGGIEESIRNLTKAVVPQGIEVHEKSHKMQLSKVISEPVATPDIVMPQEDSHEMRSNKGHDSSLASPLIGQHESHIIAQSQSRRSTEPNIHSAPEDSTMADITSGSMSEVHNTGAHRLLKWGAIKDLLAGSSKIHDNFVMHLEERKGLLRLYGRGQGLDTWDGSLTSAASPASSASDEMNRSPVMSSPPDLYGFKLGQPNLTDGKFFLNSKDHPGGLNRDGTLKLDKATMDRLQNSYLRHLHILHPFLDRVRLRRMFERVHALASPGEAAQLRVTQPMATGNQQARSLKRKLSVGGSPIDMGTTNPNRAGPEGILERRISTAIVLLVMALGKICEHEGPLPGPVADGIKESLPAGVIGSPFSQQSPKTTTSSPMSVNDIRGNTGYMYYRVSGEGQNREPRRGDRNIDVIPGLAYFTYAAEMLGCLQGGNDLTDVQANLLASLYASQLARVIESWTWTQHACRACHFLIRQHDFQKFNEKRKELIRIATWTCLQHESDILAELDLKSSGIEQVPISVVIGFPRGTSHDPDDRNEFNHGDDGILLQYYSYQIILRRDLNELQKLLYPANVWDEAKFNWSRTDAANYVIENWRAQLPYSLRWDDQEPPPADINAARLRAKFYGAKYIAHRPPLWYALHHVPREQVTKQMRREVLAEKWRQEFQVERNSSGPSSEDMPPPSSIAGDTSYENTVRILRSCRMCVEAAKRSTIAFDAVGGKRLVVTNIFGTAHAQFGNMLVLAATSQSHLSWLLEKHEVLRLLDRTINFLRSLAPISATLAMDAEILERVRQKIDEKPTSSSFSST